VRKLFASSCCFLSALAYDGHFKSKGIIFSVQLEGESSESSGVDTLERAN